MFVVLLPAGIVAIAVSLMFPAAATAQPLVAPSPEDSAFVILAGAPWQPRDARLSQPAGDSERNARGRVDVMARGDDRSRRVPFVAVGALIGAVGVGAYAVREARDGSLRSVGGLLVLPVALISGGFLGGAGGFLVSLVVYPAPAGG